MLTAFVLLASMGTASAETLASSVYTHAVCMDEIGTRRSSWSPVNDQQRQFMELAPEPGYNLGMDIFQHLVSNSASALNAFLAQQGITGVTVPEMTLSSVGCASVLNLDWNWVHGGEVTPMYGDDHQRYQAVMMSVDDFTWYDYDPQLPYVVSLATREGYTIWLSKQAIDEPAPVDEIALLERVEQLRAQIYQVDPHPSIKVVLFPKVSLDQKQAPEWLLNMGLGGLSLAWVDAQYQMTLDEDGGSVTAVSAMLGVKGDTGNPKYQFDRPFYFWVTASGADRPLMVAYVDYGSWSRLEW